MNNPADTLAALAPCPFCGGHARIDEGMRGYPCILCGACGASSDYAATDEVSEAIAAWNRRASLKGEAAKPFGHYFRDMAGKQHFHTGAEPPCFAQSDITPLYTTPPAPKAVGDGPDYPDGCSREGFVGGCERMGCHKSVWACAEALNAAVCQAAANGAIHPDHPDTDAVIDAGMALVEAMRLDAPATHPTPSPAPQGGGEDYKFPAEVAEWFGGPHDYPRDVRDAAEERDDLLRDYVKLAKALGFAEYADFEQVLAAATPPAQQPEAIDVQALIEAVLPGGSVCDPQRVADDIREYFAALAPKEKGNG